MRHAVPPADYEVVGVEPRGAACWRSAGFWGILRQMWALGAVTGKNFRWRGIAGRAIAVERPMPCSPDYFVHWLAEGPVDSRRSEEGILREH